VSIELHIERLVIDESLLGGERVRAIGAAIEHELSRGLLAPGTPTALRGLGSVVSLPPATLPPAHPSHGGLGPCIAAATLQSLGLESRPVERGQGVRR
jgi:hypothetical protein